MVAVGVMPVLLTPVEGVDVLSPRIFGQLLCRCCVACCVLLRSTLLDRVTTLVATRSPFFIIIAFYASVSAATVATIALVAIIVAFVIVVSLTTRPMNRHAFFRHARTALSRERILRRVRHRRAVNVSVVAHFASRSAFERSTGGTIRGALRLTFRVRAIDGGNDPARPCHARCSHSAYGRSLLRPAPKKTKVGCCVRSPHRSFFPCASRATIMGAIAIVAVIVVVTRATFESHPGIKADAHTVFCRSPRE